MGNQAILLKAGAFCTPGDEPLADGWLQIQMYQQAMYILFFII